MKTHHPALIAARQHAEQMAPVEACGLLLASGDTLVYQACPNGHAEPTRAFRIDSRRVATALARRQLRAVIHAHPHPAPSAPSAADRRGQQAMGIPWGIIPVDAEGQAGDIVWLGR